MNLTRAIRDLMDDAGLDALDLAARIREGGYPIAYNTVYQWSVGRRTPRAEHICVIARALGVTTDSIYAAAQACVAEETAASA